MTSNENPQKSPDQNPNKKNVKPSLPKEQPAEPTMPDPSQPDEPDAPNKLYEEQLPPENQLT